MTPYFVGIPCTCYKDTANVNMNGVLNILISGILKHLTDILELKDFLQILPDEGNMLFFLPYITKCQEKEKSENLLSSIIRKGGHLQRFV